MRIQHNIMAMSAYRNYTNNVSAMKANLEKLSSGYKINRAGDDAAGLAISEKMRAQITGLETAQKNAKDGISLVQTAEGALTEVHDMLNRMVELATQSANGTYDDTTDRAQLQKEMNQLRDEINRIADSSNFNGIKLLDGSMETPETTTTVELTGTTALTIVGTTGTSLGTTIVHEDAKETSKTKFSIGMDSLSFTGTGATSIGVLSVGTVMITATVGDATLSGAALASAFAAGNALVTIGNVGFNVTAEDDKLVFEMTDASAASVTPASFSGNFAVTYGASTATKTGNVAAGTQVITEGAPNSGGVLANTVTNAGVTAAFFADKAALTVGDTTYIFATTKETAALEVGDGYKIVDLTDLATDGVITDGINTSEAVARLTRAAEDNAMFTVGAQTEGANGSTIVLAFQEKASYSGDANLKTVAGIQSQIQIGTATVKTEVSKVKGDGKGLTLQIGDTAEDFNKLKVSIKDMHCDSLGIDKISIANQTDAASAIDAIKDAINKVSDVRGTLGATQNRLDHTINNLSVMTENIQDAESTIRDTDVAEEMMAYTKNNILIQSAQAMLAQANQVPQGVLQLLQ